MLNLTLTLLAQTTTNPPPRGSGIDPDTGALPTFVDLFNYSPIINGVIIGLSVLAVLLAVFFLITIQQPSGGAGGLRG